MKKNIVFFFVFFLLCPTIVAAKPANSAFNDDNFYQCVVDGYNFSNNTSLTAKTNLTDAQLKAIKFINCNVKDVVDVSGVEKITSLQVLRLATNKITRIDLSKNIALTELSLENNQLTSIDLSKNTALTRLYLDNNQLTKIDLSKNTALEKLFFSHNQLTSIDLSKNTALTYFSLGYNQLKSIDLSKNLKLDNISLSYNQLERIVFGNNTELIHMNLDNNQLQSIDLSKIVNLKEIYLYNNKLTKIDLSKNTALTRLYLSNNQLTNIDLSKNTALVDLELNSNQLTSIDLSKNTKLIALYLSKNQLSSISLNKNTALTTLHLSDNKLTTINLSNNTALTILNLSSNSFKATDSYLFNGGVVSYTSKSVLPSNLSISNARYKTSDGVLSSVDSSGVISTKAAGNVTISYIGKISDYEFLETLTVHISDLTSSKYSIDKENNIIDFGNDTKVSTILSNLSPLNGQVYAYNSSDNKVTSGDIQNGYKIKVENDGHVVKTFTSKFYSFGIYQNSISDNYFELDGKKVTGNDVKKQITLVNKTLDSFKINNGSKSLDEFLVSGDIINLKVSGKEINIEVTDITIGDVNGDRQINIADCVYIAQALLGEKELTNSQRKAGDYNNDGSVNIADCVAIAQKLLE